MKLPVLVAAFLLLPGFIAVAQTTRTQSADKADIANFHRQLMALKEFQEERKRIPKLQKQNKGQTVKIFVAIEKEAPDPDDEIANKILTGYIREQVGADTTDAYVIQFDKVKKNIVSVKNVGAADANTTDDADDEKISKGRHRKIKDEDAEEDEEKAPKKRHKRSEDDE